jgi:hypothetical protein
VISKASKVWLDGVAEGNDHAALCACEIFAALESGDGKVSRDCERWLFDCAAQFRYPLVRKWANDVRAELSGNPK